LKLSATVITLGEKSLDAAIASVRAHMDELVVVFTGSEPATWLRLRSLGVTSVWDASCNDENGEIADFSIARNKSLLGADGEAIVWLDSDDVVEGAENWRQMLADGIQKAAGKPVRILCPYHYGYDEAGTVNCVQWRERIVYPRSAFHWERAWHEGLVIKGGGTEGVDYVNIFDHRSVWKHAKRDFKPSYERNLRIARRQIELHGEDDPRMLFDYGMALADDGETQAAIEKLTRYVDMSGRADEKAQACLRLSVLTGQPTDLETPKAWARKAIELEPQAFAAYYQLARIQLLEGIMGDKQALLDCIDTCALGLATSGDTLVPHNPHDRAVGIYEVCYQAKAYLGDDGVPVAVPEESRNDPSLLLLAHKPPRDGLNIVFLCGDAGENWNPAIANSVGLGGSETAVVAIAEGLATYGHRVRVYGPCGREGLYDGVEYRFTWTIDQTEQVDVLVAWRNAALLEAMPAQIKWLWLHDTFIHRASPYWISLADTIVCLSQFHRSHICLTNEKTVDPNRVWVTRNGIDLSRFEGAQRDNIVRDPHKCIWSSSPDRGLDVLLECWPRIRAAVPDATLHVMYGFERIERITKQFNMSEMGKRAAALKEKAEAMASQGVILRGRVDQQTLAREMLSAGAWLYTSYSIENTKFYETACIGVQESMAAGLHVVCPHWGALPETADGARFVKYDPGAAVDAHGAEFQDRFLALSVEALLDTSDRLPIMQRARERFAWGPVVSEWEEKMRQTIADMGAESDLMRYADGDSDELPAYAGVL
jgi:glycosyltransferase involved in cell wall biosynthesis